MSGNSMVPKLLPGCYISIQPVSLDAPIMWGNIYVVVLPDFRLVKYVRRNADPELVTPTVQIPIMRMWKCHAKSRHCIL